MNKSGKFPARFASALCGWCGDIGMGIHLSPLWAVVESIVRKIGCVPQAPLEWVKRAAAETWQREHNEERPKKARGGMTPKDYA